MNLRSLKELELLRGELKEIVFKTNSAFRITA